MTFQKGHQVHAGFQKGHPKLGGRKKGTKNGAPYLVKLAAASAAYEVVAGLIALGKDPNASYRRRLRAWNAVDRLKRGLSPRDYPMDADKPPPCPICAARPPEPPVAVPRPVKAVPAPVAAHGACYPRGHVLPGDPDPRERPPGTFTLGRR